MGRKTLAAAAVAGGLLLAAAVGLAQGPRFIGRVMSPYGPVEGALVKVIGADEAVRTDGDGFYEIAPQEGAPGFGAVAAGKEGYFNNAVRATAGLPAADIGLNPIYLNDDPNYRFISPRVCAGCHTKLAYYWDQSKMSRTTSNPKLLDMYYGTDAAGNQGVGPGYKLDEPGRAGDCAVCHAPSATAAGLGGGDFKKILADPRLEWNGVSCDYCHKIRKVAADPTRPGQHAAILERQLPARGRSIMVFGPLPDVVVPPMAAAYSPVFEEGRYCASCHGQFRDLPAGGSWDYTKVYSKEEWAGFGLKDGSKLPLQTTYDEWRQWQEDLAPGDPNKGKQCQFCHLGWQKKMLPYDNHLVDGMARNMWGQRRSAQAIHPHIFEGGTATQLPNALALELEGEVRDNRLHLTVNITNTNGGHWVPTGEPMRSVFLEVKAIDSRGGELKLVEGGRLPDWIGPGRPAGTVYAGRPGAVFARVLGDGRGNLNVPAWKADRIVSDTRIRPKSTTRLEFVFQLADPGDEPSAEARLIYRAAPTELAEAKKWVVHDIEMVGRAW